MTTLPYPTRLLVSLLGLLAFIPLSSVAQTAWHRVLARSPGLGLHAISANAKRFVIVGKAGLVMTSTDGLNWIDRDPGTYETFREIEPINGGFVVLGDAGSTFYSLDGITWRQTFAAAYSGQMVAGEGMILVTHNDDPTALNRTIDGQTWERVELPFEVGTIHYSGGRLFMHHWNAPVRTSVDGHTWIEIAYPGNSAGSLGNYAPVFAQSVFLARDNSLISGIHRSEDGINWAFAPTNFNVNDVCVIENQFYARTPENHYFTSTDGLAWDPVDMLPNSPGQSWTVSDVTLDRREILTRTVAGGSSESVVFGQAVPNPPYGTSEAGIAYGDGVWLSAERFRSTDGLTWAPVELLNLPIADSVNPTPTQFTASFANDRFFLVGQNPMRTRTWIWISDDALTFSLAGTFDGNYAARVVNAAGHFLLPERAGTALLRSTDGSTWTSHPDVLPPQVDGNGELINFRYSGNFLVAHADRFLLHTGHSRMWISNDGLQWSVQPSDLPEQLPLSGLEATGDRLITWFGNRVFQSTNALNWSELEVPLAIDTVHEAGDRLVVIGSDYAFSNLVFVATRSANGIWTRSALATDARGRGLATGGGRTLAVLGSELWRSDHDVGPIVLAGAPREPIDLLDNESAGLSVEVDENEALTFQWTRLGLDIAGATSPTLAGPLGPPTDGVPVAYSVKISDGTNTTMVVFHVTVHSSEPPTPWLSEGMLTWLQPRLDGNHDWSLSPSFQGPALHYTWTRNGAPLPETTPSTLLVPVNAYTIGDRYQVTATNAAGTAVSDEFVIEQPELTIGEIRAEKSYWGPDNIPFLKVFATGATGYQWRHNGQLIPEATTAIYNPNSGAGTGFYDVIAYNAHGAVRSPTYRHQRTDDPPIPEEKPNYPWEPLHPPRLVNLSVRSTTGPGDALLVPGFVLTGDYIDDPDTSAEVLVRAVGPGLATQGVTGGTIANPVLRLFNSDDVLLATNDNWSDFPDDLADRFAAVGAFDLATGSADAALVHAIAANPGPSALTAPASDADDASGETLVELYLLPDGNASQLANLSARGVVAPDRPLTAGFVIVGHGRLPLLVRAVGAGLEEFDVDQPASAPRLVIFDAAGNVVATSDSYYPGLAVELQDSVGAFPLDFGSRNAGLYVSLEPGAYTAHAVDDIGGVVLLELYVADDFVVTLPVPEVVAPD